jgi:hypothetical protein
MADEMFDPTDDRSPAPVRRAQIDRIPGQRDMSQFEHVIAGPSADGPRVQWTVRLPDGRLVTVEGEDDALAIARRAPGCRIARRYVTPCVVR